MKRNLLLLIPLVLMLAVTPAITSTSAVKNDPRSFEYAVSGHIFVQDTGYTGEMSLTVSGRVAGPPDNEIIQSGPSIIDEHFTSYWEEYWPDEFTGVECKAEVTWTYDSVGESDMDLYIAEWYSPQPTCHGKMIATWDDGTIDKFNFALRPTWIEKYSLVGTASGETTETESRITYWLIDGEWVQVEEVSWTSTYEFDETYNDSHFGLASSGKFHTRGVPMMEGWFQIYDIYMPDFHYLDIGGAFGPYGFWGGVYPW